MRKSIWFWLSFVVALIMAVYFSTRIIMTCLGHGPVARIKTISISADTTNKNLSALAAATGIAPGTDTYSVQLDAINARLTSIPDVKTSAVRRLPNGNLTIHVKLHQAVALWTDGDVYFPLSADGTIVRRPIDTRPAGTVVFRGPLPHDITEMAKVAHNMSDQIDYIEWIENRRWNIHTPGEITIMLPEIDPYAAISTLMILDKNHGILSKKIQILDMRDPARILVK